MRQYLEEEQEDEDGLTKARGVGGLEDSSITYRKRRPVKLLTPISHPRNADYEKKKTGVSNIIRYFYEDEVTSFFAPCMCNTD